MPVNIAKVPASQGAHPILSALKNDGAVIIKDFFASDQVWKINSEVQPALDKIEAGSKHEKVDIQEFHGKQTKRLTNLVTRSPTFAKEVLDNDLLHELCGAVFLEESGTYWLNTAQIIEIGPGNKAQILHRDHDQFPAVKQLAGILGPKAPEVTVNFFMALNKFTDENGATRVIPGSHLWRDFTVTGTPEDTIPVEMEAGDVCLFSGKLVHGGGSNRTMDYLRRAISVSVQASYLTPEEAYPFIVDIERARKLSPRAQRLIGFRTQFPRGSPGLWQSDYSELAEVIGLD